MKPSMAREGTDPEVMRPRCFLCPRCLLGVSLTNASPAVIAVPMIAASVIVVACCGGRTLTSLNSASGASISSRSVDGQPVRPQDDVGRLESLSDRHVARPDVLMHPVLDVGAG